MTIPGWPLSSKALIIVGGIALLIGLMMAFISAHYADRVMGQANLGVGIYAPDPDSAEWREKLRQRRIADNCFYAGLVLTALGVILQTIGSVR